MRTAVVTGGAGGIGTAICEDLLARNYQVTSVDIVPSKVVGVTSWELAITDEAAVQESFWGTPVVDVLVNAAGITRDGFCHKSTLQQWNEVLAVNLTGAFIMTNAVLGGMRDNGFGRIVNIASVNGSRGQSGQCNYAASKAGLHGFTMSLAQEGARKNIMVNTISPGYIDTPMTQAMDDTVREGIISQIPVGRMGTPEDIARVVSFLVEDNNTYITGANIPVNGCLYTSF